MKGNIRNAAPGREKCITESRIAPVIRSGEKARDASKGGVWGAPTSLNEIRRA